MDEAKALKAYLVFYDEPAEKTHDVGLLLDRVAIIEPVFESWRDMADRLTPLATAYRYPGVKDQVRLADFEEAIDDATTILRQVLNFMRLDFQPPDEDP